MHTLWKEAPFVFLSGEEKEALSESCKTFEETTFQTSTTSNLVLSSNCFFFFWCRHPFVDKLMAITEPTEASTQLLVLGLKLYPSNMPHMLNEDLTWFMLSLSRVCQNQASEKTAFLAGWLKHCITWHFFTWIIWRMVLSQEAQCFVKVSVSHCSMVTPRRHTPNQLVKKLTEFDLDMTTKPRKAEDNFLSVQWYQNTCQSSN